MEPEEKEPMHNTKKLDLCAGKLLQCKHEAVSSIPGRSALFVLFFVLVVAVV